jgi:hypothetical protein
MSDSKKFKLIKMLSKEKLFSRIIPKMYTGRIEESFFSTDKKFILRSALKDEAGEDLLQSGVSLSIKNIDSKRAFIEAGEALGRQKDLAEVIFQEQFDYDYHGTIYAQDNLWYVQLTRDLDIFVMILGDNFQSGNTPHENQVRALKNLINRKFKSYSFLIECGFTSSEFKLFQVNEVTPKYALKYVNSDVLHLILRDEYENSEGTSSLFSLLRSEWKAFRFRKKNHTQNLLSRSFENWNFIFHYFQLYCAKNKKRGSDLDYVQFLSDGHLGKSFFDKLARKHFQLANKLREKEDLAGLGYSHGQFTEIHNHYYFLGHKNYSGPFDDTIYMTNDLKVEQIDRRKDLKIILTSSKSLISHGFLYALENNIQIVANIPLDELKKWSTKDRLSIDFTRKQILVE